jgi:hypothetical protein
MGRFYRGKICLQTPVHAGSSLADFSTLKMEAIRSSETLVQTRPTRRHIPEDGSLQSRESFRPRSHQGNWQPQRNRNFRELLSAWVEHMLLNGAAQIEETVLPFHQFALLHTVTLSGWLQFWEIAVALRLSVSLVCPRPWSDTLYRFCYRTDTTKKSVNIAVTLIFSFV